MFTIVWVQLRLSSPRMLPTAQTFFNGSYLSRHKALEALEVTRLTGLLATGQGANTLTEKEGFPLTGGLTITPISFSSS